MVKKHLFTVLKKVAPPWMCSGGVFQKVFIAVYIRVASVEAVNVTNDPVCKERDYGFYL